MVNLGWVEDHRSLNPQHPDPAKLLSVLVLNPRCTSTTLYYCPTVLLSYRPTVLLSYCTSVLLYYCCTITVLLQRLLLCQASDLVDCGGECRLKQQVFNMDGFQSLCK